ncbi:MAG: hypothetical protein AB7O97_04060 [Planctomycetota bacterium]
MGLALCSALPLGGCQLGIDHMLGGDLRDDQHGWHQWPARAGMFVVTVPLTIVVAPLAVLEEALTGNSLFQKQSPGVTSYLVGVPATVGGYATGLPFWVLGLPWEFQEPVREVPKWPGEDEEGDDGDAGAQDGAGKG